MLRITKKQLDDMSRLRLLEFIERLARDVWSGFGIPLSNAGYSRESISDIVREWLTQARARGLRTAPQMRLYVDACAILGAVEVESPRDPILVAILDDSMLEGDRKAALLSEYLVFAPTQRPVRASSL